MINNIEKMLVYSDYSVRETLEMLDIGSRGIVLVIDNNKKLIGTITDGDIRRAILKGVSLDEKIEEIVHENPIKIKIGTSREEAKEIIIKNAIRDLPIVDENDVVVDIISINDILLPQGKENFVMIMAGGLGTRLQNLTKELPKPMLKIGEKPMLHHIINNFKQYGYNKILISVNYKAEIIENYFQDGYAYGVKIQYIKEHKRLGTAGGIRLAKCYLNKPFFVINGDIFTTLNLENMMETHLKNKCNITIGTRTHTIQIPYGVLETENNVIKNIREKPETNYLINAGVYCLDPEIIELIPNDQYFEITDLINICIKENLKVGSYEIKDYWMDIGRLEDYNKANEDFQNLCK